VRTSSMRLREDAALANQCPIRREHRQ